MAVQKKPEYGSDFIVDLLKALEVKYVAFNPGATFRGLHDSIVNYGGNRQPEVISCCHEEIAVAIAHGYAKVKGRPMAAIVHNVVGLQHATMAIFNAWCDRVPVLILGATGPMDAAKRRPWIDWVHTALVQGNLVRDFVKWDDQPTSLEAVPESLLRAYRVAMTEPRGPVYVCFDVEIQEKEFSGSVALPDISRYRPPAAPPADSQELGEAAELLVAAQRPVALADWVGRKPRAVEALKELAELLALPVMDRGASQQGPLSFPNDHPLDLTGAEEELVGQADVILALDVQDLFGALTKVDRHTRTARPLVETGAKVIHISLSDLAVRAWATDFQRLTAVDLPLAADCALALPALVEEVKKRLTKETRGRIAQRFEQMKQRHDALRTQWRQHAEKVWDDIPISTARVASEVWEIIRNDDWVLTNGSLGGWARRAWTMTRPEQLLGGTSGAGLGYSLGASVGAALAYRGTDKLCVDLQPDGDFLFVPSALWTVAHHRIPLLIVMWNNRSYYNDEIHQERMAIVRKRPVENKVIGIRLEDPEVNFARLAQAYGVYGEGPIERPEDLGPALKRAAKLVREERKPALVDVVMQPR